MINDQLGFLAARDYVYKTTDGGDHWIQIHNNPVNSIQDMHVVNENMIWNLRYGFITSNTTSNDQSGGYDDFDAHMISTGLQVRF